MCPHFHLSLQSGCDDTLRRMGRKYDTAAFLAVCGRLRAAFPGCALTADLICGFPGESEEDFADTLAFLEKCGFYSVHAFPYSVRPGTKAADMPGQLSRAEKEERVRRAGEVIGRLRQAYLAGCVGRTLAVLFETEPRPHPGEGHPGAGGKCAHSRRGGPDAFGRCDKSAGMICNPRGNGIISMYSPIF